MSRIAIVGAGGHAKVVISTLRGTGLTPVAVFDDDMSTHGSFVLGVRVVGNLDTIDTNDYDAGIIAIGNNEARHRVAQRVMLPWISAVSLGAAVDPSARIGAGTVVFAGAVIQPDSVVGEHSIVNTAATIDHDCIVGNFVHLAPGVHLAGDVTIEDHVFIGMGTVVIPGRTIGIKATVGAGAVVLQNIAAGATAYGVPARTQNK